MALPDQERQELAREVLPALLLTPAELAEIDGEPRIWAKKASLP